MSRGIGRLQQDILDELSEGGRCRFALDLISSLWKRDGRAGKPSRSFQVSVWRAIDGLHKRRMIRTASSLAEVGHTHSKKRKDLAVWLPRQQPPDWSGKGDSRRRRPYRTRISGLVYEEMVLSLLRKQGGEVKYSDLYDKVCVRLRTDRAARHRIALRRAVDRLEEKKLIGTFRRLRRNGECVARLWLIGE